MCLPVTLILFSLLSILLFPFFFCFFAISICRNLRGTKKRISYRFSHREKKSCVFSAAGSLTSSSSVPRRPSPPDGVSGLRHPRCTPPTSTFFPLLTFFSFLLYIPFFNSFSFFCISLSVHLSFLFLFMRIFMCTYRLAFGTQLHQLPLTLFPCICLLVHSFFLLLCCICLAVYFFMPGYPCMHILFFMYTLAYIFNFTKCICLPDVVYSFVYIFMCVFCC